MSSRLLAAHRHDGWLTRNIDRGFDALRRGYDRVLAATLQARPAVYAVWIVLSLLIVPMYALSPAELAPNEDQGVVFSAMDTPANATLEQLSPYVGEISRIFSETPEFDNSFQITLPSGGFAGMLTRPWNERTRSIFPIQEELAGKLAGVTG